MEKLEAKNKMLAWQINFQLNWSTVAALSYIII